MNQFIESALEEFDKRFTIPAYDDIGSPTIVNDALTPAIYKQFLKTKLEECMGDDSLRSHTPDKYPGEAWTHSNWSFGPNGERWRFDLENAQPGFEYYPEMKIQSRTSETRTELANKASSDMPECNHEPIFKWLLGEEGHFPEYEHNKRYNWRTELRKRLSEAKPTDAASQDSLRSLMPEIEALRYNGDGDYDNGYFRALDDVLKAITERTSSPECIRCNDNGCPACDTQNKGSSLNPDPF